MAGQAHGGQPTKAGSPHVPRMINPSDAPYLIGNYKGAGMGRPNGSYQPPKPANINSLAAQGIQGAGMGTAQAMGYTPLSVSGTNVTPTNVGISGLSPNVTAGQLSSTNLDPYMNPYTTNVIDAQQADILRGANIGLDQLGAQAQMAGGFGGSRHGIAMSEMGKGVADMMGQQAASLRHGGYQNAQQAAMQDIMNDYNAQIANQQAGQFDIGTNLQAQLANQQTGLQGQLANQQTGLQAQLANQQADITGAQHQLGAAGQLGQLSNLGFGMGQTVNQNLQTQGAMQQALQQAVFDNAAQQYGQYTGHPAQGLAYLNAALGVTPTTPQTETLTSTPGLFDYLTLGASMKAGRPLG